MFKYFNKSHLKNYSGAIFTEIRRLGSFLMTRRFYRFLFVFVLIFAVVFTISLSDRVVPVKELHAEAVTLTVLLFLATVAAVCGVIFQDRVAISELGQNIWDWMTLDRREAVAIEAEAAVTSGTADISTETFNAVKEYVRTNFDANEYPQNVLIYYGMVSPWGHLYDVVVHDGIVTTTVSLTSTQGELYYSESYDQMTWGTNTMSYQENAGLSVYRLFVNGVSTYYWSTSQYAAVNFTCAYCQGVHSLGSNNAQFSYYGEALKVKPCYVMVKDITTGRVSVCVIYYSSGWKIRPAILNDCRPVWQSATGGYTANIIYDAVIAGNENWDIVIDGHRYVDMVKDISQLVGLTVSDVLEGKFGEIEAELVELGVLTAEIASWREYIEKLTYLEKLELLQELTYTQDGALVVSATITNQWDLDIPEVEFELPSLPIIATKFPFCIPFDLYAAVLNLVATPEAPQFDINFPASIFGGEANMDLDFSIFEGIAVVIRWIILLGFVISLIILTRKIIRG